MAFETRGRSGNPPLAVVARIAPITEKMALFMTSVHGLNRATAALALRSRFPADPFAGSRRHYIGPAEFFGHGPMLGVSAIRPGMMVNCLPPSLGFKPVEVGKIPYGSVMSAVHRIDEKKPVIPAVEYMVGTNLISVMYDDNRVKVV